MTVPAVYGAGGIFLRTNSPSMGAQVGFAADVAQEITPGQDIRTGMENAGVFESRASIIRRAPSIAFGTTQLATYFDLIGGWARCVNSGGANFGLDAYQLPHDRCSARDLTASHRYRIGNGLVVNENLTVAHQGRAEISGRVYAITDSAGNEPIVKATGIMYPNTAVDTEEFTLYRQTIGGVLLAGAKQLSIDFGVEVTQEDADGSIFPEWISVGAIVTRITLSGINPGWLDAAVIPLAGKLIQHNNTVLRLARLASGSSYATLSSPVHIGITVAGLGCITTAASSRGRGISTTDLMLYALHDGDNSPLQINTSFALA